MTGDIGEMHHRFSAVHPLLRQLELVPLRLSKAMWMLARPRWRRLLRRGLGPSVEHRSLLGGTAFTTVVDVGANIGQFAIWADEELGPTTIVCIEPEPVAAQRLRAVAHRARAEVHVVQAALGATPSQSMLYVTRANDSSSLLVPLGGGTSEFDVVRREIVEVSTGAEVLARFEPLSGPALLKIDVQGFELAVLQGMQAALADFDAVLVEISLRATYAGQSSFPAVIAHLDAAGLTPVSAARVHGTPRDPIEQLDVLFRRHPPRSHE